MAHIAKLGAQSDEFISAFTGWPTQNKSARFNAKRDAALKIFRYGQFPRVNQFDVENNLEGLEEKFRVYQKEGLADALRERLDELPQYRMKWMPEILHLLLELSDRPVKNTSLADVESLKPPDVYLEKTWKWNELVKEEPLLRDKIWENINYAVESSEDEPWSESEAENESVAETTESSLDDYTSRPEDLALPISTFELENLKADQFWKKVKPKPSNIVDAYFDKPEPVAISELHAIRETLFMLRGLPTSLYSNELIVSSRVDLTLEEEILYEKTVIKPIGGFSLSTLSTDALYDTLSLFANFGATLTFLRNWKPLQDRDPLMRRVHQEISKHVQTFDSFLTSLESKYQEPKSDVVVSLAEIQSELTAQIPLYQHLEQLILDNAKWVSYRWLEAFHTSTTLSQAAGDTHLYTTMANIFFGCLSVYLRPLRRWMEDGELAPDFFIKQSMEPDSKLSQWERYNVKLDGDGKPKNTPRFLHVAVGRIVTSGKSVVVLKKLGRYDAMRESWSTEEPPLTFESVTGKDISGLLPFPELFDEAFEKWVKAKHHSTSSMLRQCLFEECGLATSLDALENIYFLSDGATSTVLADSIFGRLTKGKSGWNDSFTLTELLRETTGVIPGIESENLRVSTSPSQSASNVNTAKTTVKSLASLQISYRLPWAVSLIVRPATLSTYRRIFIFLLQIRLASSRLTTSRLLFTSEPLQYCLVRSRLLWFCATLYNYLTDMVLVPNIKTMRKEMAEADDVDKMLGSHNTFIKRLHDQLLLGKRLELIHKTILQTLDLALTLEDARASDPDVPQNDATRQEEDSDFESSSSESESEHDSENELMSDLPARPPSSYPETLRHLNVEYERLTHFIIAGLRGVARTGKEEMWDVLAEKLESGRARETV